MEEQFSMLRAMFAKKVVKYNTKWRLRLAGVGLVLLLMVGLLSGCTDNKQPAQDQETGEKQQPRKPEPSTGQDRSGNQDEEQSENQEQSGNQQEPGKRDPAASKDRERAIKDQRPSNNYPDREREEGFDRNPDRLILTKHARCRMDCRHIDESEIREILAKGRVNHRKSEPAGRPDPKYALEGTTRDGQEVRIIIADSPRGTVVVTVIDLENEWKCNCR